MPILTYFDVFLLCLHIYTFFRVAGFIATMIITAILKSLKQY